MNLLVTSSSGAGKSTLGTALLERLAERGYQFCIIDPEGDYEAFDAAVTLGDPNRDQSADAVLELLETPDQNVIVNGLGLALADRPAFFAAAAERPDARYGPPRSGSPIGAIADGDDHRRRRGAGESDPGLRRGGGLAAPEAAG